MGRLLASVFLVLAVAAPRIGHTKKNVDLDAEEPQIIMTQSDIDHLQSSAKTARNLKLAGVGITLVGILMQLPGAMLLIESGRDTKGLHPEIRATGISLMVLSPIVSALIGAPMWATGVRRLNQIKANEKLLGFSVAPVIAQHGLAGATAAVGFRF